MCVLSLFSMGRQNAEISEVFTTGLVLNEGQRVGHSKILGSSSHILLSALQQISGNNLSKSFLLCLRAAGDAGPSFKRATVADNTSGPTVVLSRLRKPKLTSLQLQPHCCYPSSLPSLVWVYFVMRNALKPLIFLCLSFPSVLNSPTLNPCCHTVETYCSVL